MLARALSRLRQVEQQAVSCIAAERLKPAAAGPLFHSCAAAEQTMAPTGAPLARSSCSWSCNWQPSQLVVGKDLYTFDSSRFLREKMPVEVDWDHRIKDRIESPPEIREDTAEEGEPDDSGALECIKRQYQPSNIIRKRRHGFLVRLRTRGGRNVLYRRYQKGRFVPSA